MQRVQALLIATGVALAPAAFAQSNPTQNSNPPTTQSDPYQNSEPPLRQQGPDQNSNPPPTQQAPEPSSNPPQQVPDQSSNPQPTQQPSQQAPDQSSNPPPTQPETTRQPLRLGIMMMELNPELRMYFGAPDNKGVLVSHIDSNTPAAAAGIMVGDVILEVRGQPVTDAQNVRDALASAPKGQPIEIRVQRNKQPLTLHASLAPSAQRG